MAEKAQALIDTEVIDPIVRAFDQEVLGCQNNKRHVMLTIMPEHEPNEKSVFVDVFLTQEKAIQLHEELGKVIEHNKLELQEWPAEEEKSEEQ